MEKAVKLLFIFLLMLFPLGQIGRVELGGGVNILPNDVVVFIAVSAWIIKKIINRALTLKSKLTRPIILFVLISLLSLVFNLEKLSQPQAVVASLYLIRWLSYAGLYFVVRDFSLDFRKKLLYGLMLSGTASAILGLVQYFLYPNLRNLYYAGWDEHLYRLFSTFLDPNFAGAIFILTFLLAISLSRGINTFPLPKWKQGYTSGVLAFAMVVSFIALLLTYSRGSFLSFAVSLFVFFLLFRKTKLVFLFMGVFLLGLILLPKNLQSEGVLLFRTASIGARIESVERAIAIFKDNPLFGVGFNAYRYAQIRYGFLPFEQQESHAGAGTDNSFLFVLATTGIIGFVAYLYLWVRVVGEARGNALVLASIASIFVHALFVNSLFYPWILEWMWILIGASTVEKSL